MEKSLLVGLIILIVLVVFILGAGIGIFYQTQKDITGINNIRDTSEKLSSKVIPPIIAYGRVTKIDGKNITLNFSGENLIAKMDDNAQIFKFSSPSSSTKDSQPSSTRQETKFENIKVGDNLNITFKVLSDGTLLGQSVSILNSFPATAAPTNKVK